MAAVTTLAVVGIGLAAAGTGYAIYSQQQAAKQQTTDNEESSEESWSGHPSDDDKTIDADYKVKDKNKKK